MRGGKEIGKIDKLKSMKDRKVDEGWDMSNEEDIESGDKGRKGWIDIIKIEVEKISGDLRMNDIVGERREEEKMKLKRLI